MTPTPALSDLELTIAILLIALSTFVTRAGMLLLGDRVRISHRVNVALRFAPACALTALIVPEVLFPDGPLALSLANPRLPAAVAAALFLLWRPSIGGGIAVGMLVYTAVRLLL